MSDLVSNESSKNPGIAGDILQAQREGTDPVVVPTNAHTVDPSHGPDVVDLKYERNELKVKLSLGFLT